MGRRAFSIYVADAFAEQVFGGNQAGVVLLGEGEDFPREAVMRQIAGEMKHSETAFVKKAARDAFRVRYFTPVEEVALCGHATIGTFGVLYEEGIIGDGSYRLYPGAESSGKAVEVSGAVENGEKAVGAAEESGSQETALEVTVCQGEVWMDMASPRVEQELNRIQALELYEAFGLDGEAELSRLRNGDGELLPAIVNTGLSDIILPVGSFKSLQGAVQDCGKVTELSRRYQVVGVHMFYLTNYSQEAETPGRRKLSKENVTAHCRNFAPAVGIDEESATGTSNGALTWYLYCRGLLKPEGEYAFLQGEAMGKPSCVKSRLRILPEGAGAVIKIGGRAQIALKGRIFAEEPEDGQ